MHPASCANPFIDSAEVDKDGFPSHAMKISHRCSAMVAVVTMFQMKTQAFTCASSGRLRTATDKLKLSSSFGLHAGRRARPGTLLMSEMAEDYPSDTGDDRFSAGGELVKK